MVPLQVRYPKAQWKGAIAPDFKAIVIHRETDRSASMRVVAVAERIYQSLSEGQARKERLVYTFKNAGLDAACHGQVPAKELHSLFQQLEGMPVHLALVEKLGLGSAAKTRHSQLTLRIVGQEPLAEEHNRGVHQPGTYPQPKTVQNVGGQ